MRSNTEPAGTPDSAGPARADSRRAGLAYACHAWIALVIVTSFALDGIYGSPSTPGELSRWQGLGMLVILPLVMSSFVAAFAALKLTWRLRTHRAELPALLLLLASLAIVIGGWAMVEYRVVPAWFGTLAAGQYVLVTGYLVVRRWQRRGATADQ